MAAIPFPDPRLPVFGLPFFATDAPSLRRLPLARKDEYRPAVWGLAQSPAGGRIRFASDTTRLSIKLDYGNVGHMNNMCRIGQHAVDCYVDGVFWRNAAPLEGEPQIDVVLFAGVARQRRQIDLYLPLYHSVQVVELGFDDEAVIEPPAGFARELPVVYYGSSITQGGCASRSGNSYQAILSRRLNLDHVNLGSAATGSASRKWRTRWRAFQPAVTWSTTRRTALRWSRCGRLTRRSWRPCGRAIPSRRSCA